MVVNSSSTTTRVEKKSQTSHHVTSSSSSSTSEMKAHALKRDLSDMKNSMSEINDIAMGPPSQWDRTNQPSVGELKLNSTQAINQLKKRMCSSLENLVDDPSGEPLVTFPDGDDDHHGNLQLDLSPTLTAVPSELTNGHHLTSKSTIVDTMKFEEKRMKSESTTKVVTDGYSSEQATSNSAAMKRIQTGDIDYKEAKAASAMRNRLEVDGIKTEQIAARIKEAHSLCTGDITQQASNNVAAASMKVQTDSFSAEKKAISQEQNRKMVTSTGTYNQEKHVSSASQSNYTITMKGVCSTGSSMISSSQQSKSTNNGNSLEIDLNDLQNLKSSSDVSMAILKYSNYLKETVDKLKKGEYANKSSEKLDEINLIITRAWAVSTFGHELGYSLCNSLRENGGLDLLMKNCVEGDDNMKFSSARLLEQCLTTENRSHVVENGLEKIVSVACFCTKKPITEYSRVGTGIMEHLFKHSEGTCSDVIRLGGLNAILYECRQKDVEILRHCAGALANLSLYGGAENQEAMINQKVPMWLFPLAFHNDDNIKYYACLAIAVLVANKEIEAEVIKSGTLNLVEPFVTTRNPSEFAKSNLAHAHGQSKHWLQRLVPVLSSNREEARNLAAFHFCMEAGIKKKQGNTVIFKEIGAIEPLKIVASCPNAIASKFAAQALRLIGEQVPHKLSQQVPLWSVEDVQEWVKQIGFSEYAKDFFKSKVDGDLLLKLNELNLREDIGISNGILRQRFTRELQNLKKMADYSSKDAAKINHLLNSIGTDYCTYTYSMLNAGVDLESMLHLNEDMLISECGINNSIHRLRILNAVKNVENALPSSSEENMAKTLDVFVSYRRSNGSQLASLLKVHLQLRGFSVFIDVERLEAGKFDNGLLSSIRQAKHFILVLTSKALNRCVGDIECKDWVHREIVAAINSECNIIPIIDNFEWPSAEELPEDMRSVCHFNGVTWSHDYQDACIDKLERFMRGEKNIDRIGYIRSDTMAPSAPSTAASNRQNPPSYQRMQSNESDYTGSGNVNGSGVGVGVGVGGVGNVGGVQAANHQANRYRQSSSPARQLIGGIGNAIGSFGRGSQRYALLPPYRTQHILGKTGGGSMGNVGVGDKPIGGRRSSAVGIGNRPPLPKSINARSHSLDGLLDSADTKSQSDVSQPPKIELTQHDNDDVSIREKSNLVNVNNQNRKSRSLDHLLNELPVDKTIIDISTQSMENLASTTKPDNALYSPKTLNDAEPKQINKAQNLQSSKETKQSPNSTTIHASKPPINTTLSTTTTPDRISSSRQSPEGISSTDDDIEDTQSTNSTTSKDTNKNNKTFINRAVKKVRSLIKNDEEETQMPGIILAKINSPTSNKMVFW